MTLRSIKSRGIENSSSIHNGIAPPHGLAPDGLLSMRYVSIPPLDRASAADEPAGPPPITAARSFRPPEMCRLFVEELQMMMEEDLLDFSEYDGVFLVVNIDDSWSL